LHDDTIFATVYSQMSHSTLNHFQCH